MKQDAIDWVILITDNYQDSKHFYQYILGFELKHEEPQDNFCQFSLANCKFALFGRKNMEQVIDAKYLGTAGGTIYTFPESDDIDLQYQQLVDKGVHFIKPPHTQPWGQRTAYFTDPDGHIWEIQQWLK